MTKISETDAFILAAGLGTRMRHLTIDIPKPLIKVNGKSLIDYTLDDISSFGINNVVVNLHYKSADLIQHLENVLKQKKTLKIKYSYEKDILLDTGGGITKALDLISSDPFFIFNSDTIRVDYKRDYLTKMLDYWNAKKMDFLLLLYPVEKAKKYFKNGDFNLSNMNLVTRGKKNVSRNYIYTGICLASQFQFNNNLGRVYSINELWDNSIEKSKLYGIVFNGDWLHVGSPEEIIYAEKKLEINNLNLRIL